LTYTLVYGDYYLMKIIKCLTCNKEVKVYSYIERKHCSLKCLHFKTPKERLYNKFTIDSKTGCWNWTAGLLKDGYGSFAFKPFAQSAHRGSWIIHNGAIPDGMLVCHRCDNRRCVNPDHLFLGTYLDNNHDMIEKCRAIYPCGSKSFWSKLTEKQVLEIRKRHANGDITQRKLAQEYGIGYKAINKIIKRQRWNHV